MGNSYEIGSDGIDLAMKIKISEEIKTELKNITPHNYTGIHPIF